jgi:hypothetical protein
LDPRAGALVSQTHGPSWLSSQASGSKAAWEGGWTINLSLGASQSGLRLRDRVSDLYWDPAHWRCLRIAC